MPKKISDFTNKSSVSDTDLFLLQEGNVGSYRNCTKAQLIAGLSSGASGGTWQVITSNYNAQSNDKLILEPISSSITITLPSNPITNGEIDFFAGGNPSSYSITINLNGKKFNKRSEVTANFTATNVYTKIFYVNETIGWLVTNPNVLIARDISSLVLQDSPLFYFKLDETTGTTAANLGNFPSTGTYNASVVKGSNRLCSGSDFSSSFNGIDSQITFSHGLNNTSFNCTISLFVNLDSNSLRGNFIKIGASEDGISFGVGSTTTDNFGNNLIGLAENVVWIPTNVAIGTGIHHLAMTLTSNPRTWRFFRDGVHVASSSTSILAPSTVAAIGSGNNKRFCNALIDEVAIFNKILPDERIAVYAGCRL